MVLWGKYEAVNKVERVKFIELTFEQRFQKGEGNKLSNIKGQVSQAEETASSKAIR